MRNSQLNPIQKSIHRARHQSLSMFSFHLSLNFSYCFFFVPLDFTPMMTTSPSIMKMYNLRDYSTLNSSYPSILSGPISHSETMECLLRLDSSMTNNHEGGENGNSFGFTLQNLSLGSDILLQPPIIGYLEPGGIAERFDH